MRQIVALGLLAFAAGGELIEWRTPRDDSVDEEAAARKHSLSENHPAGEERQRRDDKAALGWAVVHRRILVARDATGESTRDRRAKTLAARQAERQAASAERAGFSNSSSAYAQSARRKRLAYEAAKVAVARIRNPSLVALPAADVNPAAEGQPLPVPAIERTASRSIPPSSLDGLGHDKMTRGTQLDQKGRRAIPPLSPPSGAHGEKDETGSAAPRKKGAGVMRWRVFSGNGRAVSFFSSPRFQRFSSGRHQVDIVTFPSFFEALFPHYTEPAVLYDTDGLPHRVAIPNLLATLVPQTSSSFAALYKHGQPSLEALWRATHDPLAVPMVVADEFCVDGLFGQELSTGGHQAQQLEAGEGGRGPPVEGAGGGGGGDPGAWAWRRPVLRNYWSSNRMEPGVTYLPLGPRQEFGPVGPGEAGPATGRGRLFNMLVTLATHPSRVRLGRVVDQLLHNASALEAAEANARRGRDLAAGVLPPEPTAAADARSKKGSNRKKKKSAKEAKEAKGGEAACGGGGGGGAEGPPPNDLPGPPNDLPGLGTAFVHNANEWRPFLPSSGGAPRKGLSLPADTYRATLLNSVCSWFIREWRLGGFVVVCAVAAALLSQCRLGPRWSQVLCFWCCWRWCFPAAAPPHTRGLATCTHLPAFKRLRPAVTSSCPPPAPARCLRSAQQATAPRPSASLRPPRPAPSRL